MSEYNELLQLLKKHVTFFEQLAVTEQAKLHAARTQDITTLQECMKREQADTLTLRGYDKKRLQLQEKLSLQGLSYTQMLPLIPEEYRYEFSRTQKALNDAYDNYKKISDCAKEAIEVHLYYINNKLDELRKKTKTASGGVYSPDGSVSADKVTFKDMKI